MTISLALLGVMDREPSVQWLWFSAIAWGVISFTLGRRHPLLGALGIALIAFMGMGTWEELRDPFVGPAILREAGETYPVHAYASMFVGLGLGLAGMMLGLRDRVLAARPAQRAR